MPLPSFRHRRRIAIALTLFALVVMLGIVWIQTGRLANVAVLTGGTLLCCILLLALFGMRRRIPILPLGSVSTWTQVHIYMGFFTAGVYWMHVPNLIGNGIFECTLSIIFLLVTGSGFYGLYASRILPKRLTAVEGQHRFERVDWHRGQIADHARKLLEELSVHVGIAVLGSFYTEHLNPFFNSRPSLTYVLVPNGGRRRRLLSDLKDLERHLESEGRGTAVKFAALVRRRDDLDYQFALQLRLRLWVTFHSLLTFALVAGGLIHSLLVFRFAG
ncbi:MAG TPA: hypothetical protein DEF45_04145 [Rhodopirellula sp.]|nr:hypothetical protein [Rhodopirellula sp.]